MPYITKFVYDEVAQTEVEIGEWVAQLPACTKCSVVFDDSDDVFTAKELHGFWVRGQILGYADDDVLCKGCVDHAQDLCDAAVERAVERANESCF